MVHPPAAVEVVAARAAEHRDRDRGRLAAALDGRMATGDFLAGLRAHSRVTVNFHPDRPDRRGVPVMEGLLADGRYRSQYETGISNGGRSAVPGGDRAGWEHELFGGVYGDGDAGGPRPVYGALDVTGDPHGGSPRFGSSALVLADHCWERTTFTFGDSHLGPADIGTWGSFDGVAAALVEDAVGGDGLGRGLTPNELVAMASGLHSGSDPARELDRYIECQVHGGVDLGADVDAVLLDPSFRTTAVAEAAARLGDRYGVEVRWHAGSVVRADQIPVPFRGPGAHALAQRLAQPDGLLTAVDIGRSVAALGWEPPPTLSGDLPDSALQLHKQVWHCVLAFGEALE